MVYVIVSVFDRAVGAFGRPVFVVAAGQALRSFTDEVNRPADGNEMHRHPEDYKLFEIGSFDDKDGNLVAMLPRLLAHGSDVKED